ncbi:MAG TPA: hypothetical protein PLN93_01220 [Vicinamibacterales bacterium]|nr:hypothetical protein [Vicinamibacterales bacterium]
MVNVRLGAYSVPPSEAEDQRCREAVLAVGRAVHEFPQEKHVLTVL